MSTEQKLREIIREKIGLLSERKGFKNTKNFADFLEEIEGMGEHSIRKIMGKDYVDTPGFYEDEKEDYDNDIIEFMLSNMGREEYDKLEKYWNDNVAESAKTEEAKVEEYYSAPKELNDRNEVLYGELVPGSGNAGTIEGEMIRAINRIIYRHENDGDYFHEGYGCETAGPSATFLYDCRGIDKKLQGKIRKLIDSMEGDTSDTSYGKKAYSILELILDDVESQNGKYHKSREDMYDYESKWEEEEYDEDDDEYGHY